MKFLTMTTRSGHIQFHRWVILVLQIPLLGILRGFLVEAQVPVHVDVTLRNRMDSGEVVSMDCMLNDTLINPKGFLTGGTSYGSSSMSSSSVINEDMTEDDSIFCDFRLGFVAKGLVQVAVQCSSYNGCSPLAVDFTYQGAYFNLSNGSQPPSGLPDLPWSTLLPSLPHL